VERCKYILDTVDGGVVPALLNLGGGLPTWKQAALSGQDEDSDYPHETVRELPASSMTHLGKLEKDALLPASCHCGGVSLLIKRADYTSPSEPKGDARHIAKDPTKYRAVMCACRSCRLWMSVSLIPFALIPPANVLNANSSPPLPVAFDFSASGPGENGNKGLELKHYWSSEDACWTFCGRCGASVWYWNRTRPGELDLGVGILRAEEGSMARRWLEWKWGVLGFEEECVDMEVAEGWKRGAEAMRGS